MFFKKKSYTFRLCSCLVSSLKVILQCKWHSPGCHSSGHCDNTINLIKFSVLPINILLLTPIFYIKINTAFTFRCKNKSLPISNTFILFVNTKACCEQDMIEYVIRRSV